MNIFLLICWIYALTPTVSSGAYDLKDVCHRPPLTAEESATGIFSSKRRFGLLLDVKRGESVVVTLGLENLIKAQRSSRFSNDTSLASARTTEWNRENKVRFDCLFGINSRTDGNVTVSFRWWGMNKYNDNTIRTLQTTEKYVIKMNDKGSYSIIARNYIPVQIRISIYEHDDDEYGLVIVASAHGESNSMKTASLFFTYVAPSFLVLLVFASILIASFCLFRACCSRLASFPTYDNGRHSRMRPATDKPPNYDDLFPDHDKSRQPPRYDQCHLTTSSV